MDWLSSCQRLEKGAMGVLLSSETLLARKGWSTDSKESIYHPMRRSLRRRETLSQVAIEKKCLESIEWLWFHHLFPGFHYLIYFEENYKSPHYHISMVTHDCSNCRNQ